MDDKGGVKLAKTLIFCFEGGSVFLEPKSVSYLPFADILVVLPTPYNQYPLRAP